MNKNRKNICIKQDFLILEEIVKYVIIIQKLTNNLINVLK